MSTFEEDARRRIAAQQTTLARLGTWVGSQIGRLSLAALGVALVLWVVPALAQLRYSYYESATLGGLIKVDRLTGRMEFCKVWWDEQQTLRSACRATTTR